MYKATGFYHQTAEDSLIAGVEDITHSLSEDIGFHHQAAKDWLGAEVEEIT
jgi:hypothetical protein